MVIISSIKFFFKIIKIIKIFINSNSYFFFRFIFIIRIYNFLKYFMINIIIIIIFDSNMNILR